MLTICDIKLFRAFCDSVEGVAGVVPSGETGAGGGVVPAPRLKIRHYNIWKIIPPQKSDMTIFFSTRIAEGKIEAGMYWLGKNLQRWNGKWLFK